MMQLAWYLEGWNDDLDDFDDEDPNRCDTPTEIANMPINPHRLEDARDRRIALVDAGLATYEINFGDSSIVCLCCGMVSANPNDVHMLYCGFCHEFHSQKLGKPAPA